MDLLAAIQAMFSGGGMAPATGSVPTAANVAPGAPPMPLGQAAGGSPMAGGVPAAPGIDQYQPQNGPLGRFLATMFGEGVPDRVRDTLAGMGAGDPTQPFLTNLGQGATGARVSRKERLDRKRDLATKKRDDDRIEARMGNEEERLRLLRENAGRAATKDKWSNLDKASQIITRESKRRLKESGDYLTTDQQFKLFKLVREEVEAEMGEPDDYEGWSEEELAKIEKLTEKWTDYYREKLKRGSVTTPATADLGVPVADPATGIFTLPPGLTPEQQKEWFEQIPPGTPENPTRVINPATGLEVEKE